MFAVTVSRRGPDDDDDGLGPTQVVSSRSLILATGVTDLLPDSVPGLSDCWGKSVLHCPYCHGYEFRGRRTALWMSVGQLWQMAPIVRTFTSNGLCVVGWNEISNDSQKDGEGNYDADVLRRQLELHDIAVFEESIAEIKHRGGVMTSVVLRDDTELPMDALYIRPPMRQNIPDFRLSGRGRLVMDDRGYIQVDPDTQKTSIEGVMACGDCTTPNRALSIAVASGTKAAKMLNYELSMEDWKNSMKNDDG